MRLGDPKSIFRCMGPPACLFSQSKIKISQPKKVFFNFFKITLDFLSRLNLLSNNNIKQGMFSMYKISAINCHNYFEFTSP